LISVGGVPCSEFDANRKKEIGFGTPLLQAMPTQRPASSFSAQGGVSRGEIGFADARSAPLDTPSCADTIVTRLQGEQSDTLNRSKCSFGFVQVKTISGFA
jgi:hypothetical protein